MGWKWGHVKHLSGLTAAQTRALSFQREVARRTNYWLQRRGDSRAIW
jgi:hypothetical protein